MDIEIECGFLKMGLDEDSTSVHRSEYFWHEIAKLKHKKLKLVTFKSKKRSQKMSLEDILRISEKLG
jgi:hypothetical protein